MIIYYLRKAWKVSAITVPIVFFSEWIKVECSSRKIELKRVISILKCLVSVEQRISVLLHIVCEIKNKRIGSAKIARNLVNMQCKHCVD